MKRLKLLFTIVLVIGVSAMAFAQGRGQGMGMSNYDPKMEVTVKGTVKQVQQVQGRHAWMGTHLLLRTDSGALDVHVGPSAYIKDKGFSFANGDAEVGRATLSRPSTESALVGD